SALTAVTGPLGIAVALAGALALGIGSGVQAAERLGVPFRELRNLNLDKTDAQIDQLKGRILDLSATQGIDPAMLTKGIYDAQSTMGKFGPEVESMVARIGVASRALNMDFNGAVEGMSKALVQFKLPMSDLDQLIASNAKTVQVGVVTYDQLAKVQTEYAGAAASANQQLDAANKIFTLLTVNTKNADIAATYAKAAFIDLGRGDTTKAFKKLGVDVFDANGHMRQADEIIRDLVPQLGKMSDLTYSKFKEEMGGTEGINALLDYAKASGGEVLRVLNDFDKSKFNVGDAITKANGDLDVMKNKLQNQLTTALTRLGEMVMPMVTGIVAGLVDVVGWLNSGIQAVQGIVGWFRTMYREVGLVRGVVELVGATIASVWDVTVAAIKGALNVIIAPIKAIAQALTGDFSGAWDTLKGGFGDAWDAVKSGAANVGQNFKDAFNNTVQPPDVVAKAKLDTSGIPKEMNGVTASIMPKVLAPMIQVLAKPSAWLLLSLAHQHRPPSQQEILRTTPTRASSVRKPRAKVPLRA
ncbi:MAG TPA: phage tail tape measure protein, partial [Flavobacteriales bacterium]|nr:phage tail tape measure protein [Flavobacteriales bacterium]